MPKISVIVPIYNVERYLERCIRSILEQTYPDFELLLVDDGAQDGCGAICDEWAEKDARIRVFHKANGGLSDARNYGIEHARGEYLTFVDADDYVKKTYLAYLLSLFDAAKDCLVTACNHEVVRNNRSKPNANVAQVRVLAREEAFACVLYHDVLDASAWGKLYRAQVFDTLRYPKGKLYEDTYVLADVLRQTPCVVYGPQSQYYYIQREDSIVNGGFTPRRMEFVDAVAHLTDYVQQTYPQLGDGCLRRRTHAALSVLRYMERCEDAYRPLRDELRKSVLQAGRDVMRNPRTPKRDKFAIVTLRMGYGVFYGAWRLYGRLR